MPVARSHLRNQVSRKLASSHNQVQVDCMINPQSIRFEPLSSSFRCMVPTLDPRRPPNNLQYVISNDSITFNVTGILSGLSNIKPHKNYLEREYQCCI
ncbi:hypothetical protein T4B_14038 [Trichinella pseudospiralis]|uniref:Uncharacterized protein n=1 Tax=Trichinella pseudospiralis TaxID=6337 RepID=A0A0V1EDL2_TRIPS|nr:hypothetical protein T4A_6665 [Trichinella pseudospiralis]KRZ31187.1 hypothetical protein T4B_14038 [Trichinella pseudospiralis]KRZ36982.1 hypothetical protein T4C_2941 [Trichinella pseudospiralis]